jgi:hypothetical protein
MCSQGRMWGVMAVIAVLFASGCGGGGGPSLGTVSGRVTLDGQPLQGAVVEFQPAEGRGSFGVTDAQGDYRLSFTEARQGAVLGKHTVRITLDAEDDERKTDANIPARYNRLSELTAEVQAGSNERNFELQSK